MAKTLLQATNEILKRVGQITSDAGVLTSLTSSAKQVDIDIAVQIVNEGIVRLYAVSHKPMPNSLDEGTVTLVAGTRAYSLEDDLVQLRWPFIDKTNNQYLVEFPGGYERMLVEDPEQDDTGLPHFAALRETDGKLFLDRAPTSDEAGRIYTYQYDKSLLMSTAAAAMPFVNEVFTLMVPVWALLWKRERRKEFDEAVYSESIGAASLLLTKKQPRTSYSPR